MVLTMKFTAFNININQVPANISWTYQTEIFHKKWYCMQAFEHTMFNFRFLEKLKIPSSTCKVRSHVVLTLPLIEWERLKFFSLQKAICRIKNKVYHKSNGYIFVTCTKYLTKSEWLYSWNTLLLTRLKPSEKLVRAIVTSVKTHQSLNKYKISVRNNDGNRQLDQFRHNGRIILDSYYINRVKNYGLYSTGHYKYGSPGVAATSHCVYINTLLKDT